MPCKQKRRHLIGASPQTPGFIAFGRRLTASILNSLVNCLRDNPMTQSFRRGQGAESRQRGGPQQACFSFVRRQLAA